MKRLLTAYLALTGFLGIAQERMLTMEEAVIRQRSTLAPERLSNLGWVKGSTSFAYTAAWEGKPALFIAKPGSRPKPVITLNEINQVLATLNIAALKNWPALEWHDEKTLVVRSSGKIAHVDIMARRAREAGNVLTEKNAENIDIATATGFTAYTIDNNLFVFDGKESLIVTNEADPDIISGKSVHREEFGIYKGTFWSPAGQSLAFYRMDQRMVKPYPIIDWAPVPAENKNIRYPMAGDSSHQVTVGVYHVRTGKTVFLKTGEPRDQYLTNLCWSPDEQHIYLAVLNRGQDHLRLNQYSAVTGEFEKTLFEERSKQYVQPLHTMEFVPGKNDQFIWHSERDGYNHLYLYKTSGELIRQLTRGDFVVTELAGIDRKGQRAYYIATAENAVTRNFYSVDLRTGATSKLTRGDGTHQIMFNSESGAFIDNFQSTTVPREIRVVSAKGKEENLLLKAADPLKDYALGKMQLFTLKSVSGEDLWCRLYTPVRFDSTKKYPVIVYLYNGPGIQLVNNTWNGGGDLWFQYMAQRGFIVFTLDGRGSANRGTRFEQSIHRNLGKAEIEDQLTGVNYLRSLSFVDTARLGIFGWSYGGFMTTTMMTRHPGIFKVAVAGGPVIDWRFYEIMYTERYMDTPAENPEGYQNTSLISQAQALSGKLLMIHGAQDNVVVWQHSMKFIRECITRKKQIDYFVYPGHEHNVLGPDREHLYQKVTDYFLQNL